LRRVVLATLAERRGRVGDLEAGLPGRRPRRFLAVPRGVVGADARVSSGERDCRRSATFWARSSRIENTEFAIVGSPPFE